MLVFPGVYKRLSQAFVQVAEDLCAHGLQQLIQPLEIQQPGRALHFRQQTQGLSRTFAAELMECFREFEAGRAILSLEASNLQPAALATLVHEVHQHLLAVVADGLEPLHWRLAVLRGGLKTDDGGNPLGPAQLCAALYRAMRAQAVEPVWQELLFRHLKTRWPQHLLLFYQALNQRLVTHGVLPNLRYECLQRPTQKPRVLFEHDAVQETAEQEIGLQWHINAWLRSQAALRGQPLRETALGNAFGTLDTEGRDEADCLDATGLAFALTALQSRYPVPAERHCRVAADLTYLEAQAIEQLQRMAAGRSLKLKRLHAEALVRTGLLFRHWLAEAEALRGLPELLSYLYLPVLKLALIDGRFWTLPHHAGRRWIGLLAELAEYWMPNDDDRGVHALLRGSAQRLHREFVDDPAVLTGLAQDLEAQAAALALKARKTLARSLQSARGQTRLSSARQAALETAFSRLRQSGLSDAAMAVLAPPLAACLTDILLRHTAALHSLVDGVLLPVLMAVGSEAETSAVLARLQQCLPDAVAPESTMALLEAVRHGREQRLYTLTGEAVHEAVPVMPASSMGVADAWFGRLFSAQTETGPACWVLAWVHRTPPCYLFVNRLGARTALLDDAELSIRLEQGSLRLLPVEHGNSWVRSLRSCTAVHYS